MKNIFLNKSDGPFKYIERHEFLPVREMVVIYTTSIQCVFIPNKKVKIILENLNT